MVASDPYRKLFLDSVDRVLRENKPSGSSLRDLLQLATPDLEAKSLSDSSQKKKLFRSLLLRIHPDKHPHDEERATKLCQEAQFFFAAASTSPCPPSPPATPKPKRRNTMPNSNKVFPFDFTCYDKFGFLKRQCMFPNCDPGRTDVGRCVAYQCLNAQGGIAHGKETELLFTSNDQIKLTKSRRNVEKIFDLNGGCKEFTSVSAMKEHLMTCGPIVSVSFLPSHSLLTKSPSLRKQNDFLIVGWNHTSFGEVWLIQPLSREEGVLPSLVPVAMGQFGIDDRVLAPASSLDNKTWEGGPYLDSKMMSKADPKWRTDWPGIDVKVTSKELDTLFRQIGCLDFGLMSTLKKRPPVTLRDSTKHAFSRKGEIRKMEVTNDGRWKLSIVFNTTRH